MIENESCLGCGKTDDEDVMLICDGCDKIFHTYCIYNCTCCHQKSRNPSIRNNRNIPENDWFCKFCKDRIKDSPNLGLSSVYAWGDNSYFQLGLGKEYEEVYRVHTPIKVNDLNHTKVITFGLGDTFSLVLIKGKDNNQLYSVGTGENGELAHTDMIHERISRFRLIEYFSSNDSNNNNKKKVKSNTSKKEGSLAQVYCGDHFVYLQTQSGQLYSWGQSEFGQLGHQDNNNKKAPKKISALRENDIDIDLVATGSDFALMTSKEPTDTSQFNVNKKGVFYCVGNNNNGQLGDNTGKNQWVPYIPNKEQNEKTPELALSEDIQEEKFFLGRDITILAAGKSHSVAVTRTHPGLWTWGLGENGQLGHPIPSQPSNYSKYMKKIFRLYLPKYVQALKTIYVKSVACGANFTLVLTRGDSRIFSFGDNTWGQLGYRSNENNSVEENHMKSHEKPEVIDFFDNEKHGKIKKIVAGHQYSMALMESGELYSWGRNDNGQLGLEDNDEMKTKVFIPEIVVDNSSKPMKFIDVFAGPNHSFGIEKSEDIKSKRSNEINETSHPSKKRK